MGKEVLRLETFFMATNYRHLQVVSNTNDGTRNRNLCVPRFCFPLGFSYYAIQRGDHLVLFVFGTNEAATAPFVFGGKVE